jgi:hypothetical protein
MPGQEPKPLPEDHDQWLQCNKPNRGCGRIYPVNQTKVESDVQDFAETESSPHEQGKTITGIENKRFRKTDIELERVRQRKEIDAQTDPDIKNAMSRGLTVNMISDDTEHFVITEPKKRVGYSNLNPKLRDVEDFDIADD